MPQIINFDAVAVDTIEIVNGGTRYLLRDDVSMEIIAPVVAILSRLETWQDFAADGDQVDTARINEAVAAFDDISAMVTHRVGEIFRHSLPEVTDEEIGKVFTFDERLELVKLFFGQVGKRYNPQPNSASPPTPLTQKARHRRRH
jgi:hypothetical protein